MAKNPGGLADVIAGESAICTVGQPGSIGLNYRGYGINDLAEYASFEEVAYLLVHDKLPNEQELKDYKAHLKSMRAIPQALKLVLEQIPAGTHPMDVLRTACSMLGTLEPENKERKEKAIADRLLACFPSILMYWYHFQATGRRIETQTQESSIAGHFLQLLHGKEPSELHRRAVDVSLILYAEHEFNASTFAARVTAGTLSDFYSAITSAIGTLRGPLHGGANEMAMELIEKFATPAQATQGLQDMLVKKEKIMGFGHRVYKVCDPRSDIIKKWSKKLAEAAGDKVLYPVSEAIEKVMWDEKKLFPNLDFYSATAYHFCGIPTPMFTPVFVFARTAGWAAHVIEQRANNRLIRPLSDYTGPAPCAYLAMKDR